MPWKSSNFANLEGAKEDWSSNARRENEYPEHFFEMNPFEGNCPPSPEKVKCKSRKMSVSKDNEYFSSQDPRAKKDFNGQYNWLNEDPDDYDSYAYEYKTKSYLKPLRGGGDVIKQTKHRAKDLKATSTAQTRSHHETNRYELNVPKTSHYKRELHSIDKPVIDHAATKIQAAFRGYQARKAFWKKLEHHRRQSQANMRYRQDEYTIASATSIVDDASVCSLATNADPNVGLTVPLPYIDSGQKLSILRDIKSTLTYSEEIAYVAQLQSETSPNIIVLGGVNPSEAKDYTLGASIFVYNVQKDKWFFGGTMPEPRNYHTAAVLNGKIYVIGGYSPLQISHKQMVATQTTFQLSVRSKRWRKRADMHQARACHGMCIINDNIVVMGGRDVQGKLLSTVEMYYPQRDQWVLLKSMPEALMGLSCAVLDGCIFVIGGIVNEGGHLSRYAVSNRTYAFDFEKQLWYKASSLPEPRAFGSVATLKREIWLWCGVKDSLNEDGFMMSTNSVLVYNSDVAKWEQHTAIGTLKHAAAIAKFGRRIYLLGGISNSPDLREVLNENDYYNRETDKYMEGASLPRALTGSAALALPIDYIATGDPKFSYENVNDEVMNEAATKIQAVYRGYKTRSVLSSHQYPVFHCSDVITHTNRNNVYAMRASVAEAYGDRFKMFQRVQIDEWPPVPDIRASNSDVNLRFGTLPRGYTITSTTTRTKVRRYVLLPPHADPNLSMMGHLCNVYKRAKKILGLRKVDRLPAFAINLITAPTLQDDSIPVLLIMGGLQPKDPVNLSYAKLVLRYHVLKDRWEYFGSLPEPRNYHAAVYYQDHIYVTGGCDPDKRNSGEMVATSNVYCLNIYSSEWVEKAEMHCARAYHNMVVALGKIFVIGGRDNNGRLVASIEAYDVENDKWSMLRPMANPRMGMACGVIDDHIWCMGGIGISDDSDSLSYPVLSSVISYDIGKDIWISRPPLRCPRAYGSCVVVNNSLWLVGGASKDYENNVLVSMASIDKYYPIEAEWSRKTLMSNPRHSSAVVAVDTCVYILGGVSSQEWSPLARNEMVVVDDISLHTFEPLPVPLTGIAAVAIPPVLPSLRSESLANLLHVKLTYH